MSQKQQYSFTNATMLQACMALQTQISFADDMIDKCVEMRLDAGAVNFWKCNRQKAAAALNELTGI